MSDPKNQHLLPRFYLSLFCDEKIHQQENHDEYKNRSRCRVWVHDKQQGRIRERGVNNLSTVRHYYSLDEPDGGRDPSPERVLARLEGRVSQIMKDLRYGSRLRRDEVVDLATFMAVMKFRVSSYWTFSAGHVAQNEARIRTAAFPSLEALRQDLRRHGHPEAEDPEAVERVFRDIHSGAYEMTVTKNHMLLHMFSHSQKIAKLLLQQNWTFAWALKGGSFATSDDPVLVMGPDLRAPSIVSLRLR